ncbi:hypothetical protein KUL118_15880 [Tenacibaculum sp. KUL118]|nr:hypothetical protein KUL118_15880 [Tenacibaculum sp. KUL118]
MKVYSHKKGDRKFGFNRFLATSPFWIITMFGLFKSNPTKKLRKQYDALLEKAMHAQRNGDIKTYSLLTAQSEQLWKEIEALEQNTPKS